MFKLHLDLNISIKLGEMLMISFVVFFALKGPELYTGSRH